MSYTLPATMAGGNLQRGEAAFFKADLAASFSRQDVEDGTFTLSIDGADSWVPNYFAVFGIGPEFGTPRVLIPFVATTGYPLHVMSSDTAKGRHTLRLPKARVLRQVDVTDAVDHDDIDGVLASSALGYPEDVGLQPETTAANDAMAAARRA